MPIIYNSNFATGAGAAMREFKDVNKSYRDTMLKLEDMRRREEENEARRAQASQLQQARLEQNQKQFDVQMDFKQQQLAGSQSRVGDQFAPVTGAGILGTIESMTSLNAAAQQRGDLLIDPEEEAAFGSQVSGLLGRQVTEDTPITPEELDNHPNRRELYRLITGRYNQMATLDAQQQLTGSYEGTAQALMQAHPDFAKTPAGLAILDEMSAAYADALQEDELSPRAAAAEAQAFQRSFIAGATRMAETQDARDQVHRLMHEPGRKVTSRDREAVAEIMAKLDNPKYTGSVNDVRLEALRVIDPDSAEQYMAGQTQASLNAAAAAVAGAARQQAAPPTAAPSATGNVDSTVTSAGSGSVPANVLEPNSAAARVFNQMPPQKQRYLDFLEQNGVELLFDEEENRFIIPTTDEVVALTKQFRAPMKREQAADPRADRLQEEEDLRALPPDEREKVVMEREFERRRVEKEERESVSNELSRKMGRRPRDYEVDEELERRRTLYKAGDRDYRTKRVRRMLERTLAVDPDERFASVPVGPNAGQPESPTPSEDILRQESLTNAAAVEEQRMLAATAADQQRRKQMADPRGRAQLIARQGEKQQIAIEQMLQDIAPGSRELAQVLMQNQIPFELDEGGHVIVTEELKEALMSDDVQLPEDNQ